MIKTIVIGESCIKSTREIEISNYLSGDFILGHTIKDHINYKYMELICKNYCGTYYDMIFAYNNPNERNKGLLLFRLWNSGILSN